MSGVWNSAVKFEVKISISILEFWIVSVYCESTDMFLTYLYNADEVVGESLAFAYGFAFNSE